ncbi:hypothetical protein DPMN_004964 [Dreissena polymorpha]|uniref:Uncharacterized protein n=1 Tax=Dreissena polymorpha TaxID=45954 RepID=A0A9D4RW24_DREPO|nr:hypothetical protein DPMN_004964 [Dreissena polymorpha]
MSILRTGSSQTEVTGKFVHPPPHSLGSAHRHLTLSPSGSSAGISITLVQLCAILG